MSSDPLDGRDLMLFKGIDKVVHFLMYFALAGAYLFDYTKYRSPHHNHTSPELGYATLAAVLGFLFEIVQLFAVPGRSFENGDIVADVLGAAAAFLVVHFWARDYLRHQIFDRRRHRHKHYHKKRDGKHNPKTNHHHHHHHHEGHVSNR